MNREALITPLMTYKEIATVLASKARAQRKALKLSRAELAKRSGVSVPTISRFELTGVTSLAVLIKLAQAMGAVDTFAGFFATPKYKSMQEFLEREK